MTETPEIQSEFNVYMPAAQHKAEIRFLWNLINPKGAPPLAYIGGSYAAWALPRVAWEPGDVDVWAVSNEAWELIAAQLPNFGYHEYERTDIAAKFGANGELHTYHKSDRLISINLVRPHPNWVNFPEDIINSFDLSVSRAVLIDEDTVLGDRLAGREECKILMINDPLRTLERVLKYHKRGHEFTRWELLKLFRAWDDMTPERKQNMIEACKPAPAPDEPYEDGEWEDDDEDREYGFYEDDYFEGE